MNSKSRQTVFSYIVQKRLSQENENVATSALEFILGAHESAQKGMMKLLRGIVREIPPLRFRTQQTEGDSRPDMQGSDDENKPHVLIENKFWAGLTAKQPISYLRTLADYAHPTLLLIIAPEAREQTLWREIKKKLSEAEISLTERNVPDGITRSVDTGIRPILALTSWEKLLNFLERELADDQAARSDLLQLRALCVAVDSDAFAPISEVEISGQRTPAFILQLNSVVQESVELAVTEDALNLGRLMPQADAKRIGRYAFIGDGQLVGIWLGIHFGLWKMHGSTPLWVVFSLDFGRSFEVRNLLEPWAKRRGVLTASDGDDFVVALNLPLGEEKRIVAKAIVERLKEIAGALSTMKPIPQPTSPQDGQ